METKKQLYPLKFIPIPSKRVWGGSNLIKKLGKEFYEADEDGNEQKLTTADSIGESWELADMGVQDSVVSNGWLAGNTISELMETYLDRIVGEDVYDHYGPLRQAVPSADKISRYPEQALRTGAS